MENIRFKELTKSWLTIAENFALKTELESHTNNKYELSNEIYDYLEPITSRFIATAVGESNQHYDLNLAFAININRLLKSKSLRSLNANVSDNLVNLIKETFSLGILTHLFLFNFPTREKYSRIDLKKLENDWIVDAVAADSIMGYYGDKQNPICMNIWEFHFQNFVLVFLKQEFRINLFRMGKFQSFFRNLYVAGALLVMNCDLESKKI